MRLLLLVSVYWCATVLAVSAPYYALEDAAQLFEDFITKYDKHYASEEEKASRFEIFKDNLEKINHSNNVSQHAFYVVNQFADLTSEEFINTYTGLRISTDLGSGCTMLSDESIPDAGAPESFDWRDKGVVSPVKNQHTCGCCYAFSSIGHLESQYAIKYTNILDLSEQQVVDCDTLDQGCKEGVPPNVFTELMRLGGSMNETDYPYENEQQQCRSDPSRAVVHINSCNSYNLQSQEKLKQLLYKTGPISVCIQGDGLQGLGGGIHLDNQCSGIINHVVLLVGYGTDPSNTPYWIVKNSWGQEWGDAGYFYLQRSDNPQGACKMLNNYMASAVIA